MIVVDVDEDTQPRLFEQARTSTPQLLDRMWYGALDEVVELCPSHIVGIEHFYER